MLLDLQEDSVEQSELELDDGSVEHGRLMRHVDQINDRFGPGTVALASAGVGGRERRWTMPQELRALDYTTQWTDLPQARAWLVGPALPSGSVAALEIRWSARRA